MSYILEALRRAQNERGASPLAGPGAEVPPPSPGYVISPGLLATAGAVFGALLLALAAWKFWPQAPPPAEEIPAPPVAVATPVPPPAAPSAGISSLDDLAPSDNEVSSAAIFSEVPPLAEDEAALARPRNGARRLASEDDSTEEAETLTPEDAGEPQSSRTRVQTMQLDAAPESDLKTLRDMPADFRAAFPKFKIEVHVYDDDPAGRFVRIDGARYGEGQPLPSGPLIKEITSTGIICSFRNTDVLVSASDGY